MCEIAIDLVKRNGFDCNVYLRPVVYKNSTQLGPELSKVSDGFMCYAIKLDDYLDTSKGLEVCVSS